MSASENHNCTRLRTIVREQIEAFKALASISNLSPTILIQSLSGLLDHVTNNADPKSNQPYHAQQVDVTPSISLSLHESAPHQSSSVPFGSFQSTKSKLETIQVTQESLVSTWSLNHQKNTEASKLNTNKSKKRLNQEKRKRAPVLFSLPKKPRRKSRNSTIKVDGQNEVDRDSVRLKRSTELRITKKEGKKYCRTNVLPITAKNSLSLSKLQLAKVYIEKVVQHGKKRFKCQICQRILTAPRSAQLHIRRIHFNDRIPCHKCRQQFYDYKSLNSHLKKCGYTLQIQDPLHCFKDEDKTFKKTPKQLINRKKSIKLGHKMKAKANDGIQLNMGENSKGYDLDFSTETDHNQTISIMNPIESEPVQCPVAERICKSSVDTKVKVRNPFVGFDLQKTLRVHVQIKRISLSPKMDTQIEAEPKKEKKRSKRLRKNKEKVKRKSTEILLSTLKNDDHDIQWMNSDAESQLFELPFDIEVEYVPKVPSAKSSFVSLSSLQLAELNEWYVD